MHDDPCIVEVMLNADGVVWVDGIGEGLLRTPVIVGAAEAKGMLVQPGLHTWRDAIMAAMRFRPDRILGD